MVEQINWQEPLPSGPKQWYPIFRPPPGGRVQGYILTDHPVSVRTHWYDDAEWPCTLKTGRCIGCEGVKNERWTAYVGLYTATRKTPVGILPITLHAAMQCRELLLGGSDLRGYHVIVRRVGTRKNSACYAEIGPKRLSSDKLPPAFDLRAALVRLWGFPSEWIGSHEDQGQIPY